MHRWAWNVFQINKFHEHVEHLRHFQQEIQGSLFKALCLTNSKGMTQHQSNLLINFLVHSTDAWKNIAAMHRNWIYVLSGSLTTFKNSIAIMAYIYIYTGSVKDYQRSKVTYMQVKEVQLQFSFSFQLSSHFWRGKTSFLNEWLAFLSWEWLWKTLQTMLRGFSVAFLKYGLACIVDIAYYLV